MEIGFGGWKTKEQDVWRIELEVRDGSRFSFVRDLARRGSLSNEEA